MNDSDALINGVGGLILAGTVLYALALVADKVRGVHTGYRWRRQRHLAPPIPARKERPPMPYGYTSPRSRVSDGAKMDRNQGLAPTPARVLHFNVRRDVNLEREAAADMARRYDADLVWTEQGVGMVLSLVFRQARRDATEINKRARSFGWSPTAPAPGLPEGAVPSRKSRAPSRRPVGYYMDYFLGPKLTDAAIKRALAGLNCEFERFTDSQERPYVTLRWEAGYTKAEEANYRRYLEEVCHWVRFTREHAQGTAEPLPWDAEPLDPEMEQLWERVFQGDDAAYAEITERLSRLPVDK